MFAVVLLFFLESLAMILLVCLSIVAVSMVVFFQASFFSLVGFLLVYFYIGGIICIFSLLVSFSTYSGFDFMGSSCWLVGVLGCLISFSAIVYKLLEIVSVSSHSELGVENLNVMLLLLLWIMVVFISVLSILVGFELKKSLRLFGF